MGKLGGKGGGGGVEMGFEEFAAGEKGGSVYVIQGEGRLEDHDIRWMG